MVDIIKVVREMLVFDRLRRVVREVQTWELAIFIKFLESAVIKYATSKPDVAAMLLLTSDRDVLGPLLAFGIVSVKMTSRYASKEMVINLTRDGANSVCTHDV